MDSLPSGEPAQGASGQVNRDFGTPPDDGDVAGRSDYDDQGAEGQIGYGLFDAPPLGATAPSGTAGGFDVDFSAVAPLKFKPGEFTTHTLPAPLA